MGQVFGRLGESPEDLGLYLDAAPRVLRAEFVAWAASHPVDDAGWASWMDQKLYNLCSIGCGVVTDDEKRRTRALVEDFRQWLGRQPAGYMTSEERNRLKEFLSSLASVPWLSHPGEPFPEAFVVANIAEGWDRWNPQMMALWQPESDWLGRIARAIIGDPAVEEVFAQAAGVVGPGVAVSLGRYFERHPVDSHFARKTAHRGLWSEVLETIKRDVAWAAIEVVLSRPRFFSFLMPYYTAGRWPCGWNGQYPDGQIVLL